MLYICTPKLICNNTITRVSQDEQQNTLVNLIFNLSKLRVYRDFKSPKYKAGTVIIYHKYNYILSDTLLEKYTEKFSEI